MHQEEAGAVAKISLTVLGAAQILKERCGHHLEEAGGLRRRSVPSLEGFDGTKFELTIDPKSELCACTKYQYSLLREPQALGQQHMRDAVSNAAVVRVLSLLGDSMQGSSPRRLAAICTCVQKTRSNVKEVCGQGRLLLHGGTGSMGNIEGIIQYLSIHRLFTLRNDHTSGSVPVSTGIECQVQFSSVIYYRVCEQ